MIDVYNIMWLIVIAYILKWPVKILAKMSLKLCVIFYNIFMRKSKFLLIGKVNNNVKT